MIVIYIPPADDEGRRDRRGDRPGVDALEGRIPVATAWMSTKGLPAQLQKTGTRIPSFAFPEQAAIAMARAAAYGRWRERPVGSVHTFDDARPDEAYAILATALGRRDDGWLSPDEVERLLQCYGLRTARSERASTPEEAGEAAAGSAAGSPSRRSGRNRAQDRDRGCRARTVRGR